MVLCDIGNSTFCFKNKKKYQTILIDDSLDNLYFKQKIYFISVNKKATKKLLKKFPDAINIEKYIKLNSLYDDKLGIDRKIVCSTIKNGIIVDAGSAITIDIVKDYKHLGGFILPGIKKYLQIYPKISKKLKFYFENKVNLDKIPTSTNEAINCAIFNSIILLISNEYKKHNLKIYLTGGDGFLLKQYLNQYDVKYDKNMIFKAMKQTIKRNNLC